MQVEAVIEELEDLQTSSYEREEYLQEVIRWQEDKLKGTPPLTLEAFWLKWHFEIFHSWHWPSINSVVYTVIIVHSQ